MSDKKGDSNELDSYGVWVKNSPLDIHGEPSHSSENAVDEFDLPDFGEAAGSDDIFKDMDIPPAAEEPQDDSLDDGETSLNPDELANIVMEADAQISEEEFPQSEGITDEETAALSGAFFSDDPDVPEEEPLDDAFANSSDETAEIPEIESAQTDAADAVHAEQENGGATASEETDGSFEDGEIDLDDFMGDSGGSQEISFDDGEIDLGDFMGGGSFSGAPSKEPAEINDEQTLGIDVEFDEEAETIAVEDTPENEAAMNAQDGNAADAQGGADDEMFSSFDAAVAAQGIPEPAPSAGTDSQPASSEEIDLSEFGFDDDDSKIGITDGPDGSNPIKKQAVNYVMKVAADDDTDTPSVKDVINGKISAELPETDSEEDYTTNTMENTSANAVSPEISEKGKEILEQIMAELSSLRDEIKNIKTEFASLQSHPPVSAAQDIPPAPAAQDDDSDGFFGSDDEDDTIALSGSEMTDILNSVEITQAEEGTADVAEPAIGSDFGDSMESDSMEEPHVEENIEQEIEESAISEDELDIPDPTLEGLPDEISVPTNETFNNDAINEYMGEDTPIENSLTEDNLSYLETDSAIEEVAQEAETQNEAPNVDEIMQDNISLQDGDEASVGIGDDINAAFEEADATESNIADDSLAAAGSFEDSVSGIMQDNISLQDGDEASVGIGDDINAAFEEADATESNIADDSLAAAGSFEDSVSGIMQENISLQDGDEASVGIGDDINAAFEEADATESDIIDDSLAAKDAYEQEINKNVDGENEEPVEFEEPVIEEPLPEEPTVAEPLPETVEETSVEEPVIDGSAVAEPTIEEAAPTEHIPPAEENYAQEINKTIDGDDEEPVEFEEPVIEESLPEEPTVAEPLPETVEETSVEEPVINEPAVAEPTIEEAAPTEHIPPAEENDAQEIDADAGDEKTQAAQVQQTSIPKNLKEEVISVLSYMDQLLENLPEDKITEFAKSEHFATYKKLFDELGLS